RRGIIEVSTRWPQALIWRLRGKAHPPRRSPETAWPGLRTWTSGVFLAGHRPVTDVPPALHSLPRDRIDQRVGLVLRLRHARAQPHRAQHAPAAGEDPAALGARAGVKHLAVSVD